MDGTVIHYQLTGVVLYVASEDIKYFFYHVWSRKPVTVALMSINLCSDSVTNTKGAASQQCPTWDYSQVRNALDFILSLESPAENIK